MAFSIDSKTNNITLVRGDYFATVVGMKKNGVEYIPSKGTLRFAMKKSFLDKNVLISKNIPLETRMLELESSDTKGLKFDTYVYDIEYTDENGHPDTFISAKLILTEEVL